MMELGTVVHACSPIYLKVEVDQLLEPSRKFEVILGNIARWKQRA
jgi:hypothetical protein